MSCRRFGACLLVAVLAGGCGSATLTPRERSASATAAWINATAFARVVGDLQTDTAKIATATTRELPVLTMQTLCGILLLDVQNANNDLPSPNRTATSLLATAYGDLGAGANQCFKATSYHSALMEQSIANRSRGLIALARATSRFEEVIGQPIATTTTTTTMP